MKTKKFNKFRNIGDYEIVVGFRLVPTQEEIDKEFEKMPHLRLCLDCHAPILAKQDRCHICKGKNFKVISK